MFIQVVLECVPSAADTHHDVTPQNLMHKTLSMFCENILIASKPTYPDENEKLRIANAIFPIGNVFQIELNGTRATRQKVYNLKAYETIDNRIS